MAEKFANQPIGEGLSVSRKIMIANVAQEKRLTAANLFEFDRRPRVVQARDEAMLRLMEDGMTRKEIAQCFQRDWTTVHASVERAQRRRKQA
ncbi:MAG: hypothetical protein AAGF71_04115 [Pseudomonadota bacterium]